MKLILTEKPSVAISFAKALNVKSNEKKDGHIEDTSYCITWAVGHLVQPYEPQMYDPKYANWSLDTLPILPYPFQYVPSDKTKKQFNVVKRLLERKDITEVIIATDAGREGEQIARLIFKLCNMDGKKLLRFWSSQALTPDVITKEMANLKPAANYDRLYFAGQCRQIADWYVGMNLSRFATLKFGDSFSVGRCQTAILGMIVDRERAINDFKPSPFFVIDAAFSNDKGTWQGKWFKDKETKLDNQDQADAIVAAVTGQTGKVESVDKQEKRQAPPLLYNLTVLQQDANKKHGLSAKQTLDTAQKLYEEFKCISYPRTESEVMGTSNVDFVKAIIDKLAGAYPVLAGVDPAKISLANKRVFNDAKLTDHHALVVQDKLPDNANERERHVYNLILNRFAAAFHPDFVYEQTEVITTVAGHGFKSVGRVVLETGWKTVSSGDDEDDEAVTELPPLASGDSAKVDNVTADKKLTTPPAHYTEASLLKEMSNPGKYVADEKLKKVFRGEVGIGTSATRASLLETLFDRVYVLRDGKKLMPTKKGYYLIDELRRVPVIDYLTQPDATAAWEYDLDRISLGKHDHKEFVDQIRSFVKNALTAGLASESKSFERESIGKCPSCGGKIIEGKKGFGCANYKEADGACKFVIWKTIAGKAITPAAAVALLESGNTGIIKGFESKAGKKFSAALKLEQVDGSWKVNFDFDSDVAKLICPSCGGELFETQKSYSCSNWKDEKIKCNFVIWKKIAGKTISSTNVKKLIEKGQTGLIKGFTSKAGKSFDAKLKLVGNKVEFEFSK